MSETGAIGIAWQSEKTWGTLPAHELAAINNQMHWGDYQRRKEAQRRLDRRRKRKATPTTEGSET